MKKKLGGVNAMYPMPVVLVGTEVDGRINYMNVAHVGIIDLNTISLSLSKVHYTNKGIKQNRTLSINLPSEDMVVAADYVGLFSGAKVDKSKVFESFYGELPCAPMIKDAPLSMECEVVDILDMPNHDVFLVRPKNTYCDTDILTDGKIDLARIRPMLFDMHQRKYWRLGEAFENCWNVGTKYGDHT